jgi:ADP-ribose pyrophosphatase
MKVEVREETIPWAFTMPSGKELCRIVQAKLTHEQFNGEMTPELTRINLERGDGVCLVVYLEASDEVLLVEQFRYPAYAGHPESDRADKGWLLELVAGMKDADGPAVAERELQEETGCKLTAPLELLTTFYVSPGGTSERMEVYLARVKQLDGLRDRAGIAQEGEDIRPHLVPLSEALEMVKDGRIEDGKTMIGLLMLKEKLGR